MKNAEERLAMLADEMRGLVASLRETEKNAVRENVPGVVTVTILTAALIERALERDKGLPAGMAGWMERTAGK